MVVSTMKDPYMFDFINYTEEMLETDIENELVKNVTSLLMELGTGFAFMGQQYHLEVGGKDFYIDLLFYNTKLRCYVAIDLKTGEFKPEQAGKMNFYLSALDDLVKAPEDNPSVGLILCRDENRTIAEYGNPEQGIMIETPAAAIISDELAKEVDFFSIGTNDLSQYTLAIDRQNTKLDPFFDPHHPAILRMIQIVVENAHKAGIWAGICGELGADQELTKEFLAMGVDELSVSPGSILPLRKIILETNVAEYKAGKKC